jgi:hypothetical protein
MPAYFFHAMEEVLKPSYRLRIKSRTSWIWSRSVTHSITMLGHNSEWTRMPFYYHLVSDYETGTLLSLQTCYSRYGPKRLPFTRCDNLIPGMALWKQNLLTCALAAAVAFEILSLWSYALAGFQPRWPGFDPRSGHVGFVVDKVLRFPLPILIPPTAP